MQEAKTPLLENQEFTDISNIQAQFNKVHADFIKINDYYELIKGQTEYVKAQNKKGVKVLDGDLDSNGAPIVSSMQKLAKKKEMDIYVKRANNFFNMLKDSSNQKSDKSTKSGIKGMIKEYDSLYVNSRKKLDYIAKDLAKVTNVTSIGGKALSEQYSGSSEQRA